MVYRLENIDDVKHAVFNDTASLAGAAQTQTVRTNDAKGKFIFSLGHSRLSDKGAPNASKTVADGDKKFDNESDVIQFVFGLLCNLFISKIGYINVIPWMSKSGLASFISSFVRKIVAQMKRTHDCLIQIHCDMVKRYALEGKPGELYIFFGSKRGSAIADSIKAKILAHPDYSKYISHVFTLNHKKSWRGSIGFINYSADTALLLEYDSVARDKDTMAEIAKIFNLAILETQDELKNIPY